jgi:hypothetical protein
MAATTGTVTELQPNMSAVVLRVEIPATADTGDTVDVDLNALGCTKIDGILGFRHTATGSIIVTEAPTTSVSAGVLTITVGGAAESDQVRTFIVFAY